MKQLSKERLEEIAGMQVKETSGGYEHAPEAYQNVRSVEIVEMARALLAGMAQDPSATVFRKGDNVTVIMIGVDLPEGYSDVYTNAAPPAPVVPDIGPREFDRPKSWIDGFNACRDAILQGVKS